MCASQIERTCETILVKQGLYQINGVHPQLPIRLADHKRMGIEAASLSGSGTRTRTLWCLKSLTRRTRAFAVAHSVGSSETKNRERRGGGTHCSPYPFSTVANTNGLGVIACHNKRNPPSVLPLRWIRHLLCFGGCRRVEKDAVSTLPFLGMALPRSALPLWLATAPGTPRKLPMGRQSFRLPVCSTFHNRIQFWAKKVTCNRKPTKPKLGRSIATPSLKPKARIADVDNADNLTDIRTDSAEGSPI